MLAIKQPYNVNVAAEAMARAALTHREKILVTVRSLQVRSFTYKYMNTYMIIKLYINMYIYIHVYIHMNICIYVYIYVYIEREREKES